MGGGTGLCRGAGSTGDSRIFDLASAAQSQTYCEEVAGICREAGVVITELSTHLQGQLIAVHPCYDEAVRCLRAAGIAGPSC